MPEVISSAVGRDFAVSVERAEDELAVHVRGSFDAVAAPTILAAVEAAADLGGRGRLVFDLSDVRFLDSAGISVLVRGAMLQELAGGSVAVRNPPRIARRLLELMRLTNLIPVEVDIRRRGGLRTPCADEPEELVGEG